MKNFRLFLFILLIFSKNNIFCISTQNNEIDSILKLISVSKNDTLLIKNYLLIGNTYLYINPDSALFFYNKSNILIQKNKKMKKNIEHISFYEGSYYIEIGIYNAFNGNMDSAKYYFEKALSIYNHLSDCKINSIKNNSINQIPNIYTNLGNIYDSKGEFPLAIETFQKALKKYESKNDTDGVIKCLSNIGIVHHEQNNFVLAREYYFKVLDILKSKDNLLSQNYINSDFYVLSAVYTNIGISYLDENKFKEAKEYFLKSLEINQKINNKKNM